jgi:GTPase SAR1 family protein
MDADSVVDQGQDLSDDPFVSWAAHARSLVTDRNDLVDHINRAAGRAMRQTTVIAVVGEFKQGKSALVNSLLSEALCPVDDHVATSVVTVVSYSPKPMVAVRRRGSDGNVETQRVDPATRRELITESGADGSDGGVAANVRSSIERVDIRVPNPLLADGLVLVDTPGVGGLSPAHAAATRAFLPSADAVIFVSDATSELTETEVSFLTEAVQVCPDVVVALTKIDLFPHWRRIRDLNRGHLERAGIDTPLFPVSFPLRLEAARGGGDDLAGESGYPDLLGHLGRVVVPRARSGAVRRSIADISRMLDGVATSARAELQAATDPAAGAAELAGMSEARDRLAGLTAGGARWRTVLQDEVTDLSQEVTFRFRDRIRGALDALDATVDAADNRERLDAATEAMRSAVVNAVQAGFAEIETGVSTVSARVAMVMGVAEFDIGTPEEIADAARDADAAWRGDDDGSGDARTAGDAFSVLRGAQGGVLMLAIMGGLLPAAAASVVVAAPFMVGAGVLFGGKQILDLRSQKQARARQRLKVTVRKSVDDVQFRVGAELGEALRAAQRHLRDELGRRIDEAHRTTSELVERLDAASSSDAAERQQRVRQLEVRIAQIDAALRRGGALMAGSS